MSLLVEVRPLEDGPWREVATLTPASPEGSMSSNPPGGGRDVIMFRCVGSHSVIRRSRAGADYEAGAGAVRVIHPAAGLEELATLHPGESYEMPVVTDRGLSCVARWTHLA